MRELAYCATFVVVMFGSACGGGGGATEAEMRSHVEEMIRQQLPGSVQQNTGEAVLVSKVTCVSASDSTFDCIANVGGLAGGGNLRYVDIPVSATCDEDNCTWRTDG